MTVDVLNSTWKHRFLYDWLIPDVLTPLHQGLSVILHGGPGTGKSTIARRISGRLDNVLWIDGRAFEKDSQDVLSKLELAKTAALPVIIDDVDVVYAEPSARDLLSNVIRRNHAVLFTTTLPPTLNSFCGEIDLFKHSNWNEDLVLKWSVLLQHPELNRVDPWKKGWQREIGHALRGIVGESANQEQEISAWWTIVVHLTGGHPVMMNEAFAEIARTIEFERSDAEISQGRSWFQEFSRLEEYLHGSALRRMRHAAKWLSDHFPKVAGKLKEFAKGQLSERQIDGIERRILTDSGLMHRGHAEGLVVSGSVLKQYLQAGGGASERFINVIGSPDGTSGRIVISIADAYIVLTAGETVWKIVDLLNNANGSPVPIDTLKEKLNVTNPGVVRSALQRLRDELKDQGVDGVIENVRGTGYRLGRLPILQHTQRKL